MLVQKQCLSSPEGEAGSFGAAPFKNQREVPGKFLGNFFQISAGRCVEVAVKFNEIPCFFSARSSEGDEGGRDTRCTMCHVSEYPKHRSSAQERICRISCPIPTLRRSSASGAATLTGVCLAARMGRRGVLSTCGTHLTWGKHWTYVVNSRHGLRIGCM